jgi:serine/threonine protein kinase, bacterial
MSQDRTPQSDKSHIAIRFMPVAIRTLGSRYLLDEQIGQGGMGVVWRGRDKIIGTHYAIKVLRSEYAADPDAVTRFVRERTVLMKFRHPAVVSVHDMIVEGDQLALVMDLVDGGDLNGYRQRSGGVLSGAETARIGAQICDGLAAAHAAGIVHRDLKPANVLLTGGEVRLADFGVARIVGDNSSTTTGTVLGTAAYLAPEMLTGSEPSAASDMYALGVTLYEVLGGQPPFTGHVGAIMHAHLEKAPVRILGVADQLWDLVSSCLAKTPDVRPTAAAMAQSLREPALVSVLGPVTPVMLLSAPVAAPPVTPVVPVITASTPPAPAVSPPAVSLPAVSSSGVASPAVPSPALPPPAASPPQVNGRMAAGPQPMAAPPATWPPPGSAPMSPPSTGLPYTPGPSAPSSPAAMPAGNAPFRGWPQPVGPGVSSGPGPAGPAGPAAPAGGSPPRGSGTPGGSGPPGGGDPTRPSAMAPPRAGRAASTHPRRSRSRSRKSTPKKIASIKATPVTIAAAGVVVLLLVVTGIAAVAHLGPFSAAKPTAGASLSASATRGGTDPSATGDPTSNAPSPGPGHKHGGGHSGKSSSASHRTGLPKITSTPSGPSKPSTTPSSPSGGLVAYGPNLLADGDFADSTLIAWNYVQVGVILVPEGGMNGGNAVRLTGTQAAAVGQTVSGLTPGASYLVTGWVQTNGEPVYIGAMDTDGSNNMHASTGSASWTEVSKVFTVEPGQTSADVFCIQESGGTSYCADMTFRAMHRA